MLNHVWLFVTPLTVAPLPMGFSRQQYWNGLPFPSPGDIPNPSIEPGSPVLQADSLPSEPQGENWVLKNWCLWIVVLEKTLQSPLDSKEIKPVSPKGILNIHWKVCCWSWNCNSLAIWWEELTHWKRPWCWERLKAGGEQGNREWDGWMASPTQWTWVWANSGNW